MTTLAQVPFILSGSSEGTWTLKPNRAVDFKSTVYTVPPHCHNFWWDIRESNPAVSPYQSMQDYKSRPSNQPRMSQKLLALPRGLEPPSIAWQATRLTRCVREYNGKQYISILVETLWLSPKDLNLDRQLNAAVLITPEENVWWLKL